MSVDGEGGKDPFGRGLRERLALLERYLLERGVQRSIAGMYGLDAVCRLLIDETRRSEMAFAIVDSTPEEDLMLIFYEADMGPKPIKSGRRLEGALGVARPDGIISIDFGLPWFLTTSKGATIAAQMGYVTVPLAEIWRILGVSSGKPSLGRP